MRPAQSPGVRVGRGCRSWPGRRWPAVSPTPPGAELPNSPGEAGRVPEEALGPPLQSGSAGNSKERYLSSSSGPRLGHQRLTAGGASTARLGLIPGTFYRWHRATGNSRSEGRGALRGIFRHWQGQGTVSTAPSKAPTARREAPTRDAHPMWVGRWLSQIQGPLVQVHRPRDHRPAGVLGVSRRLSSP